MWDRRGTLAETTRPSKAGMDPDMSKDKEREISWISESSRPPEDSEIKLGRSGKKESLIQFKGAERTQVSVLGLRPGKPPPGVL